MSDGKPRATESPSDPRWWERLASTEANVEALSKDVQMVVQSVRDLGRVVSDHSARIESRLSSLGRTDWGMLSGWAAVILSIVALVGGAVGFGFTRDINRIEEYIISHETWSRAKASELDFERGRATQQREDLRAAVVKLDIDLQREMRDVNATTEARLDALDRRIQTELGNAMALMQTRIAALESYQFEAREMNAAQTVRLDALERVTVP